MLDALFKPKSVAVIGASSKTLHIGNRIIKNLMDYGYKGDIYPINPKSAEIRGLPAYPSILDVPGTVDVAHMVIPAKFVPAAVDDCGKKGVKHIIINSGGFSETGPEGAAIENDFLERAQKYGIRIFGPNCQGIINTDPRYKAYCNFTFTYPEPGHISIVAQSGGVAEMIHQAFTTMGVGTRIYASNGNACDITIPEILLYLASDHETRVIVTYVEGLRDPEAFRHAAASATARKPVLAMKAGRTKQGAKAAASHTGILAKQETTTELIFRKSGVLSFQGLGTMIQAAAAFATQPIPKGNRVGIITNTGGPAVITTDVLVDHGMTLPPLSEKNADFLRKTLHPEASVNNPVDVLATGTAAHYHACLDVMTADDTFDAICVNFVTPFFVDTESIAKIIATFNQKQIKPIVCNLMTDYRQWTETVRILKSGGVPCFSLPGDAARALSALTACHRLQTRKEGRIRTFSDTDRVRARAIAEKAKAIGKFRLPTGACCDLLKAYGIPVAKWQMAASIKAAETAAEKIGYPVVIKADAPNLVHKSDKGGVAVNLMDGCAVREAVETMQARLDEPDLTFLIQQFIPGALELVLGVKAEPGLGHILMFGLGGVHVEMMKDITFELTPVTETQAWEMLEAIKGAHLLKGFRGQKSVNRDALVEVIQRLSQLVTEIPEIHEMDLNPILAFPDRVVVVDTRISLMFEQV